MRLLRLPCVRLVISYDLTHRETIYICLSCYPFGLEVGEQAASIEAVLFTISVAL